MPVLLFMIYKLYINRPIW